MPTGYTAIVAESDNATLKDFALRCARSFGALICMRDEPLDAPIPEKFEPADYYVKQLEEAKREYDEYVKNKPTDEDLCREYEAYVAKEKADAEKENAERRKLRERYDAMLAKVTAWQPPTGEHYDLKRFMIEQLNSSIHVDCNVYVPHIETKDEYIDYEKNHRERSLLSRIDYYKDEIRKERDAYDSRNKWIDDLRKSL